MEPYWLFLRPDTFLWCKGDAGVVYNTENKKSFVFRNIGELKTITENLSNIDNLYCVDIAEELGSPLIREWIDNVRSIQAGGTMKQSEAVIKPVCYFPVLSVQCDPAKLANDPFRQEGVDLYTNLKSLTIYLNGDENGSDLFQKQFIFPARTNSTANDGFLDFHKLEKFFLKNPIQFLSKIDICGDVFRYRDWGKLSHLLSTFKVDVTLHLRYPAIIENVDRIKKEHSFLGYDLNILVVPEDYLQDVEEIKQALPPFFNNIEWSFILTSNDDIERYEERSENMDSFVCHLLPGYTGHNEGFFEKFVFVDEHDIRLTALEKREIFAHQVINTFFWGNLIIDCDGEIYANMNHPPIGTTDTPLSILLNREISESGSSWKMIRDRKPCMDCIYQYLCPSPSNYELIMNRPNLCSVWKNDGKILV